MDCGSLLLDAEPDNAEQPVIAAAASAATARTVARRAVTRRAAPGWAAPGWAAPGWAAPGWAAVFSQTRPHRLAITSRLSLSSPAALLAGAGIAAEPGTDDSLG